MLEFYYDCLCKYIPRSKFECVQMDTDSLYFALAHDNLIEAVYPHLRSDFNEKIEGKCGQVHKANSQTFFPRTCCQSDRMYDRRTEGLFKEEYTGYSMIALCSKTYIIDNEGQYKLSCKGVNKKTVSNPKAIMCNVLKDQVSQSVTNRGFRAKANSVFTYRQERVGFNYFYCKRQVEEDGIHTRPLDIILSPWSNIRRHIFKKDATTPLCNSYCYSLVIEDKSFQSIRHFIHFQKVKFLQGEQQAATFLSNTFITDSPDLDYGIDKEMAWYGNLEGILQQGLSDKYAQCADFRNQLDQLDVCEIVYADKDAHLGCGMEYNIAILTDSQKFPGQNILGESLLCLKKANEQMIQ